jgi:hypothetical protein
MAKELGTKLRAAGETGVRIRRKTKEGGGSFWVIVWYGEQDPATEGRLRGRMKDLGLVIEGATPYQDLSR